MLYQVNLATEDRERAKAFYRDVIGLPLLGEYDPPGLVFFDLGGGTRLLLEGPGGASVLYLGVDDIDAERARLESRGVTFEDEIHRIHVHDGGLGLPAGTEEWMTFFRDSEGNVLALNERRAAAAPA
jgi:methylmalonyl-CoA/ethylmalonyl-CoA epimerase